MNTVIRGYLARGAQKEHKELEIKKRIKKSIKTAQIVRNEEKIKKKPLLLVRHAPTWSELNSSTLIHELQ